jgi:hypothetical protein
MTEVLTAPEQKEDVSTKSQLTAGPDGMLLSVSSQIIMRDIIPLLTEKGCSSHYSKSDQDSWTESFPGSFSSQDYEVTVEGMWGSSKVTVEAFSVVGSESVLHSVVTDVFCEVNQLLRGFFYKIQELDGGLEKKDVFDVNYL